MEEVKERYIRGINMNFEIKDIGKGIIEELEHLFEQFEGDMPVNFTISDREKRHQFELYSSEKKINICSELLDELKRYNIDYQLVLRN